MNFFIKRRATLPLLRVEVNKDGRNDFHKNQNLSDITNVYVSLIDFYTKQPKFISKPCTVTSEVTSGGTSYYINYQFSHFETEEESKYEVQFSLINGNGNSIILPLKEKIYANVVESFSLDNYSFGDNYIVDRPCCDNTYTPEIVGCDIDLVTEIGFDLITESGLFITPEMDSCPPLPCDIALINESGFDLVSEHGEYLIDEINNCPPSACDISVTNESGAYLFSEYGEYLIEEETIC